jgi:hypothetical protein
LPLPSLNIRWENRKLLNMGGFKTAHISPNRLCTPGVVLLISFPQ